MMVPSLTGDIEAAGTFFTSRTFHSNPLRKLSQSLLIPERNRFSGTYFVWLLYKLFCPHPLNGPYYAIKT